LKKTRRFW